MDLGYQVQQTHGFPHGDCVRTSYASLLKIPVEDVPKFDPGTLKGANQLDAERKWLRSRGFDLVIVPYDKKAAIHALVAADQRHLISGLSPRFHNHGHRVVGRGGKVEWDPHPSGVGITAIKAFYFVVPRL